MRTSALVGAMLVLLVAPVLANPTGAPLVTHPVEPCRFLDTRPSVANPSGSPLPSLNAMDAFVRGSQLQAVNGAAVTNCKVPSGAESVVVNIVVINPATPGHLMINGSGFVHGPNGPYSRINYNPGQTVANEMQVSLCNVFLFPHAHEACPFDGAGRYLDFQILNAGSGPVHIIGDVVAYLMRLPGI